MSVLAAIGWGAFASASLYIGQALAAPLGRSFRVVGLVMGFGAGTLLSAVAYELIPERSFQEGWGIAVAFLVGALVYYGADGLIDSRGGAKRQHIAGGEEGSGPAMFLGALLDGLPEAFILGISLALGGSVSIAFVAAVFVSNIPQGLAGTTSLQAAGYSDRRIFWMWTALTATSAACAAAGFLLADSVPDQGVHAEAFAAGAVLVMLADSMMPEAFRHGGNSVGLLTVLGYLAAAALTVVQ
jgi:ZIP family zinc transporter